MLEGKTDGKIDDGGRDTGMLVGKIEEGTGEGKMVGLLTGDVDDGTNEGELDKGEKDVGIIDGIAVGL